MSKTLVDIDDDALAKAMAHYGTSVKKEAINRALREIASRRDEETAGLEEWVAGVGRRLGETDWQQAWD